MSIYRFVFPLGFLLFTSFIDNCKIRKGMSMLSRGELWDSDPTAVHSCVTTKGGPQTSSFFATQVKDW